MNIKEWSTSNIVNFNNQIKTEEDVKIKIVLPYLKSIGYDESDMLFELSIPVQVGSKRITNIYADIAIKIDDNVQLIIDTKEPNAPISEKSILQCASYAKLISTPPAIYAVVTNGVDCIITNIFTGKRTDTLLSKNELISDVSSTRKKKLSDIQLREVNSVLITLYNEKELYTIINKCKDIIEKRALIRSDQSFKEMTKILLVKMNEERRANNDLTNRFLLEHLQLIAKKEKKNVLEIFTELFTDAKAQYPVYSNSEEPFKITDIKSIEEIVKLLEPWSFLGTGDDIKGAVYEIFLKSSLRGEFDQYFTPREIVDYMIQFANPTIGDKILEETVTKVIRCAFRHFVKLYQKQSLYSLSSARGVRKASFFYDRKLLPSGVICISLSNSVLICIHS